MKPKTIEVVVFKTQDSEPDFCLEFDTIGEAKHKAKHYLTHEYQLLVEASTPWTYAQVTVNGECLYDYFA